MKARGLLLLTLITGLSSLWGCGGPSQGPERGEYLFGYCSQCHGLDGSGIREFRAPAIAGLPDWYLESQLMKFRTGARGDHPDDVEGLRMRPMSRTLASEADVKLVAQYVAGMPVNRPARTVRGDVAKGSELYQPCVACHGARGEGMKAQKSPPLRDSSDWYLLAQLKKFKTGIRGTDPLDETGAQMRPLVDTLIDENAMKDVVSHIMTLE